MSDTERREPSSFPTIIPLQRTLVRRVIQVFSAIMLLWFGVYLGLNDRSLGRLISKIATGQIRGQFILGYAHYDYWSSLGSLILNTPAPVVGGDFELHDPNGALVMKAQRVEARMYIGEFVRGLLRSAVSAPFGRGVFIELHMASGHLRGGWADVHPISLPRPPGVIVPPLDTPYTEVNIVATMSSRKPKPEDAPPSPGHVRIVLDSAGVTVEDITYEMGFSGWHGRLEGVRGTASLRYSSDPSETRPGLLSFFYEVAPLSAEKGELVLGTKEGAGEFVFPLKNIALRRFGARASRRQDLVFRGQLEAAGAAVELDGTLMDTYCDPGVRGEDLYPLLFKKAESKKVYEEDPVRFDMMKHFGRFVTESSGHFSEYLPYYRKRKDLIKKYCRPGYRGESGFYSKNWPTWRSDFVKERKAFINGSKPIPMERTWEYASWIIQAIETNAPFVAYCSVPNRGLIDSLPASGVVETACLVNSSGVMPTRFEGLPAQCAALCDANMRMFDLAATACIEKSREAAAHALMLDPLTAACCSPAEIKKMTEEMFKAQRDLLPGF